MFSLNIKMFFNFQALLYILETMTFFPHLVAIQWTHFFNDRMYLKGLCFWRSIFPLYYHCYDNWKKAFFLFSWQTFIGKQIHSTQFRSLLTQTTVTLKKMELSRYRLLKKNCCKEVSPTVLLRTTKIGPV